MPGCLGTAGKGCSVYVPEKLTCKEQFCFLVYVVFIVILGNWSKGNELLDVGSVGASPQVVFLS